MVAVKLCHPNCDFIVDGNKERHGSINAAALRSSVRPVRLNMLSENDAGEVPLKWLFSLRLGYLSELQI